MAGYPGGANGIEVFVQAETVQIDLIMKELQTALPPYMVPRNIRVLPRFPLNASGKFNCDAMESCSNWEHHEC